MRNLFKIILILFAGMLSYGSISMDFNEQLLHAKTQDWEAESTSSFLTASGQVKGFCLHQSLENLVNPLNHFPRPESKYHPVGYGLALASVEAEIRNIAAQYLSFSKVQPFGFSVSDIIFPFHYFW